MKVMSCYEMLWIVYASGAIATALMVGSTMVQKHSEINAEVESETGVRASPLVLFVALVIMAVAWPALALKILMKDPRP